MVSRLFSRCGCLFALGIVTLSGSSPASAAKSTVEFVGTGPTIVTDGSATARVHNFTGKRASVRLSLTWPDLRDPNGHVVSPTEAFAITPGLSIPAGSEKTVHVVRVAAVPLAVGDYAGTLKLSSPRGFDDRIAITMLVEPAIEAPPLESPVKTWEVVSQRPFPWVQHEDRNADVPLQQGSVATDSPSYQTTLLGSKGGSLVVLGQVAVVDSYPYLMLTFVPGPAGAPPGTYTGALDLAPDDDMSEEVTLTVQRRDEWFLPAFVLAAALFVAWFSQRWWNSGRRLSQLKVEADAAKQALGNGNPPPIGGLQLSGVLTLVDEAGARRRGLARRWAPLGPRDEGMMQAEADVKVLQDAAELWTEGELQASIGALQEALEKIEERGAPMPPGALSEKPALVHASLLLLIGSVPIDDLTARRKAIDQATTLASKWPELQSLAGELGSVLDALEGYADDMSSDERRSLRRARALHAGVLWDLWHAKTGSDLLNRHAASELERVDEAIGQLSHWLGPPLREVPGVSSRAEGASAEFTGLAGIWRTVAALFSAPPDDAISMGDRVLIRTLDASFVLIASAVSIWGALVLLYFDKPFGGWRDYLSLVAWALGTTAALDIINGGLGKLAPPKATEDSAKEVPGAV